MLDLLGEIESDLSAFHRIDDMWELDAARFFRLARRLPAYSGAVAAAVNAEQEGAQVPMTTPVPAAVPAAAAVSRSGARVVGSSAAELRMSDVGDLFSFGGSGG